MDLGKGQNFGIYIRRAGQYIDEGPSLVVLVDVGYGDGGCQRAVPDPVGVAAAF